MGEPELPFRKVIIDSRNAVTGDSENFVVSLPSTLQLPPNTACYVLSVALSYGFYTVRNWHQRQTVLLGEVLERRVPGSHIFNHSHPHLGIVLCESARF